MTLDQNQRLVDGDIWECESEWSACKGDFE